MQSHLLFILLLLAVTILSVVARKLTIAAAVTAAMIGTAFYIGTGVTGICLIGTFFILGISVTAWKRNQKQKLAPKENSSRDAWQVLANGGIAAVCGCLTYFLPEEKELLVLMSAGSLSSATADTVSSELGTVYGKRFYNITNFRKDARGENGVVSLEGTLFGLLGSSIIVLVYWLFTGLHQYIFAIIVAGTIGNLVDSILGATLERKGLFGNNSVNLLNTLAGALVAFLFF